MILRGSCDGAAAVPPDGWGPSARVLTTRAARPSRACVCDEWADVALFGHPARSGQGGGSDRNA